MAHAAAKRHAVHVVLPFPVRPVVFINALIITVCRRRVYLLAARYIFLATCLSRTGIPYKDDAVRGVNALPTKNCSYHHLPTIAIFAVVGNICMVSSWIFDANVLGWGYVFQRVIPLFTLMALFCTSTFFWAKVYILLLTSYFVRIAASVFCIFISNARAQASIDDEGRQSATSIVINYILIGVAFPCFRYLLIWLTKTVLPVWKTPRPTTREEEIAVNVSKVFGTMSEIYMVYKASSARFYYSSTIGLQISYAIERVVTCYARELWLRKRVKNGTENVSVVPSDCVGSELEQFPGETLQQTEKGKSCINLDLASPKRRRISLRQQDSMKEDALALDSQVSVSASKATPAARTVTIHSPLLPPPPRPSVATFSVKDSTAHSTGAGTIVSEESVTYKGTSNIYESSRLDFLGPQNTMNMGKRFSTGNSGMNLNISKQSTQNILPSSELVCELNAVLDVNSNESSYVDISESSSSFEPMDDRTLFGYLRLGSMIAEWSSRCIAFLMVLFFASLPDVHVWASAYSNVTYKELVVRFFTWPPFAIITEVLCAYAETRIMGIDFSRCAKEMKSSKLSVSAFHFLTFLSCSTVGVLLVAETGLWRDTSLLIAGRLQRSF
ncbi:hypothetical protein BC829DRAFT_393216 [Chytridium lagenaria]|nr:hypothetical protein BC829DRAFT_393216 [Chytridium lagenaria]